MILCCNLSETILAASITGACTLLAAIVSVWIVLHQIKANKKFVYEQKRKEANEDVYSKVLSNLSTVLVLYKLFAKGRRKSDGTLEDTTDYANWVNLQKDIIPLVKDAQMQLGYLEIRHNENPTIVNKIKNYSEEFLQIMTEYNSGENINFPQLQQRTEELQKNVKEDLKKLWNDDYNWLKPMINTNNTHNPLSVIGLFLVLLESIVSALMVCNINIITPYPWMIGFIVVFITIFPLAILSCFMYLTIVHPAVLYSPKELSEAGANPMNAWQKEKYQKEKSNRYGDTIPIKNKNDQSEGEVLIPSQQVDSIQQILEELGQKHHVSYQRDVCVRNGDKSLYFDAYANQNGCHWIVEMKEIEFSMPLDSLINGIKGFVKNANQATQGSKYLTLVLIIEEGNNTKIDEYIRSISKSIPEINISVIKQMKNGLIKHLY